MADVRWLNEREYAAWSGLQRMQLRLEAEMSRQVSHDSSLSLQDYVVLVKLTEQPDGQLRAFALARLLGWDKTRLSHHIKRMISRGLVEKRSCPTDRRGYFVAITEYGRRENAAAAPGHLRTVRSLFLDHLDDHEIDVLARLTNRVLTHMDADPGAAD